MKSFLAITRALSDETRLRALLALRQGELCLCQIISLLGMAFHRFQTHGPVYQAGLVEPPQAGKMALLSARGTRAARRGTKGDSLGLDALANEPLVKADARQLCCIRKRT